MEFQVGQITPRGCKVPYNQALNLRLHGTKFIPVGTIG